MALTQVLASWNENISYDVVILDGSFKLDEYQGLKGPSQMG